MLNIDVYSTRAVIRSQEPLTVGLVGGEVRLRFSDPWKTLTKTVVFRQNGITRDVLPGTATSVVIPWEVLQTPGLPVEIGICGYDGTGKVVIPTVWAVTDPVQEAPDPMDDESTAYTLPIYQQLSVMVDQNAADLSSAREDIASQLDTLEDMIENRVQASQIMPVRFDGLAGGTRVYDPLGDATPTIDLSKIQALSDHQADRMRIGIPLTLKDPKLNFDTEANTITWEKNFFMEYKNNNYTLEAQTLSYYDVGNVIYFCFNLDTDEVQLTGPANYNPETQVVVFVFVVSGLKSWDYACTLPFPYMVDGKYVRVADRMRIGIPLALKDPELNFNTTAKTITWENTFYVEYKNNHYHLDPQTLSYSGMINVIYFCFNLETNAVELTKSLDYDPENQVVVFAFVMNGLGNSAVYACTLPFPYMVNGEYVRDALPNPHKLTLTGAVTAEYDGSGPVTVNIPREEQRSIVLNPGDDIQAAVDAGYTTIVLNAGKYPASLVTVRDKNEIRFVVPDAGSDSRKMKKNVVIDNSIDLPATKGDILLTASFQAPADSNWYKVFVTGELPPERTGLRSASYNAILWETDTADNGNDTKLIPVLSRADCEDTPGSFYYSHADGKVYIHPLTERDTNVYKRLQVEEGSLFSIENVHRVYMENIEVKYAPKYVNLKRISDFTAASCVVSHTAYEGGFQVDGVNGIFRDCEAYKVTADGFGIGGSLNGYTEYFNCSGHHCYDDGISHHNGSAGAIYGGVWHHNGKAGIAPAHGSVVNVYNAVAHDNSTGFYSKSDATVPEAMGREAHYFNCIAHHNKYGISVKNYHVTAYGCQFVDNEWKDTTIDSAGDAAYTSLTIIPVGDDGNTGDLTGYVKAPATATVGQTIVVKSVDGSGKPTEWEAADLPSGGSGGGNVSSLDWEPINTLSFVSEDGVTMLVCDQTADGQSFAYDEILIWNGYSDYGKNANLWFNGPTIYSNEKITVSNFLSFSSNSYCLCKTLAVIGTSQFISVETNKGAPLVCTVSSTSGYFRSDGKISSVGIAKGSDTDNAKATLQIFGRNYK